MKTGPQLFQERESESEKKNTKGKTKLYLHETLLGYLTFEYIAQSQNHKQTKTRRKIFTTKFVFV